MTGNLSGQITSRNKRGGVTAIAGWLLVVIGVIGTSELLAEVNKSVDQLVSTGVPLPWFAPTLAAWLVVLCIGVAGGGVLLIGFAREERDREEELHLDPLSYQPYRHPWRRVFPWFVLVVVALVIPSLYFLPVPTTFGYAFPVSDCLPGSPGTVYSVTIPAGATLAYHWTSSNGQPVAEVWAPSGAQVSAGYSNWGLTAEFFNSSSGNSAVQSNGSAISFWACDFAGGSPNVMIELSGTYYTNIL